MHARSVTDLTHKGGKGVGGAHGQPSYGRAEVATTPFEGNLGVDGAWSSIICLGDARPARRSYARLTVSATTADRRNAAWLRSGALVDAGIAAVALAGSLALMSHGGVPGSGGHADLDALGIGLAVFASAPILAWRRSPIGAFAVTTAASALLAGLGYPVAIPLGPSAALFLLAASRDGEDPWTLLSTAIVVVFFSVYAAAAWVAQESFPESVLLHSGLAFAVGWFAGERARLRREHVAELRERATRAERAAEREQRLAVAEERARIARDLHDATGQAINVIAVRAGAARTRRDPERSQAALETIEEIARQTAAEIDGIVGTLRDRSSSNGTADAPIGLASLDTLIARRAVEGLDVSVTRHGMAPRLDGATDQAAYRILQEALTNILKHAGAARSTVTIRYTQSAVELCVEDDGNGAPLETNEQGHGLVGMRERVSIYGGTLETAGRPGGGFRVLARLPLETVPEP